MRSEPMDSGVALHDVVKRRIRLDSGLIPAAHLIFGG